MLTGMVAIGQTQTVTTLKSFTHTDGEHPLAGLTASDGVLFGTTWWGGSSGNGTLFKVNTDGTGYTVLRSFTSSDGAPGFADLNLTLSGSVLFGTASGDTPFGYSGSAKVFRVNTDGTDYAVLKNFANADGVNCFGVALSGNVLYGTTSRGGSSTNGTVFKINTDGTSYTILKDFGGGSDGASPRAGLTLAGGVLYGTTIRGGSSDYGTVFKVNTDGTGHSVLKNFAGSDGGYPWATLTASDGVLYGTTYGGGSSADGTIFKVNTNGTGFTVLKHFSPTNIDGAAPRAGVTISGGVLYGTTPQGGNSGHGTVFRVNTDGTGFAVLKHFNRFDSDGAMPEGGLCLAGSALYGTTSVGGGLDLGTVFKIDIDDAAVRYVSVDSTNPVPPYLSWATAANVIQDAVDVALPGDEIVVTNGVYATGGRAVHSGMTNRVAVTKPITIRSVNGPDVTVIRGYQIAATTNGNGAVRCLYLADGAALIGFTLTHGAVTAPALDPSLASSLPQQGHEYLSGGGVFCESTSAVLADCVLIENAAVYGGGACSGTLNRCSLIRNTTAATAIDPQNLSRSAGGGAVRSTLNDCTLTGNIASFGGGAYFATLNRCTLTGNAAQYGGGASHSTLNQSLVTGNSATNGGGTCESALRNCVLLGNVARLGGGVYGGGLDNCTLVQNVASEAGGGVWALVTAGLTGCHTRGCYPSPECGACVLGQTRVDNCIIQENVSPTGSNHFGFTGTGYFGWPVFQGDPFLSLQGGMMDYSFTTPMPTNGVGNITNAPMFVGPAAGNFRLQSNSPCINAGRNSYAPLGLDLDGNARIAAGTVDMGAYEFQSPQSKLSYAWLQQYGLPTDGSADFVDPDADGHNNWQEWRAWTVPTNSTSVLRLLTPSESTNGVILQWQSAIRQTYFVERSTNVLGQPMFVLLASNLVGSAGMTTYADTNSARLRSLFYRVGVQE